MGKRHSTCFVAAGLLVSLFSTHRTFGPDIQSGGYSRPYYPAFPSGGGEGEDMAGEDMAAAGPRPVRT